MTHEFLSLYPAHMAEYLLAVTYLVLFIPFWKYVQGGKRAEVEVRVAAPARARAAVAVPAALPSWFQIPSNVYLHPGHTWARVEADGTVTVGADDFAHKLVGPTRAALPTPGADVVQGEAAFYVGDSKKSVPMIAPVDGKVVAVNAEAAKKDDGLGDPYGKGWLFKVRPTRLKSNLHQLLGGATAKRFLDAAGEALSMRLTPELGAVLQDGGVPIDGLARAIAGEEWDAVARRFFLT